jgi:hypothetical protein
VQKLQPLRNQVNLHFRIALDVATRPVEASHEAKLDWIETDPEHDWNSCSGCLRSARGRRASRSGDDRHTLPNQVFRLFSQTLPQASATINHDVTAFNAHFGQSSCKRVTMLGGPVASVARVLEHPNDLRFNRQRGRRCAPEPRDEVSPSHCDPPRRYQSVARDWAGLQRKPQDGDRAAWAFGCGSDYPAHRSPPTHPRVCQGCSGPWVRVTAGCDERPRRCSPRLRAQSMDFSAAPVWNSLCRLTSLLRRYPCARRSSP